MTRSDPNLALRQHLLDLLVSGHAHVTFDAAIRGIPPHLRNRVPRGLPYSPWQLLEHMRLAQWDIVAFSRGPGHVSPEWPEGYWPPEGATESSWRRSVAEFRRDREVMRSLVTDASRDLFEPFAWGEGQTLLREALLVADHNAYHVGELIAVRRLLGAWKS